MGWGYWIKWGSAHIVPSSVSYTVSITIVIVTERPEGRLVSDPEVLLTPGCRIGILQPGVKRGKSCINFIIILLTRKYNKVSH